MNFKTFLISIYILFSYLFSITYAEPANTLVSKIEFKGLITVSEEYLYKKLDFHTKYGSIFILEDIEKDINNLFLTGNFNSVKYEKHATADGIKVIFICNENPIIKEIQIVGNSIFTNEYLQNLMQTKVGKILNINMLNIDSLKISEEYKKLGYALFKVDQISFIDKSILKFVLIEGEIQSIGFKGIANIKDFVLRREMRQRVGSIFNTKELREDRADILSLGYFSSVSAPYLSSSSDTDLINVDFRVSEKKINLFDTGIEYDEEKVVGFFKLNWNHLLMHSDVISLKTQVDLQNNISLINSYSVRYNQPWFLNLVPIEWSSGRWLEYIDGRTTSHGYNHFRDGWDTIFTIPIFRDRLTFSTKFKNEFVSPVGSNIDPYSIQSVSNYLLYRTINSLSNPISGTYWKLEFEKGGDLGFIKLPGIDLQKMSLNWATFFEPVPKNVLGFHFYVGKIKQVGGQIDTETYDLGGANSLRGFLDDSYSGQQKIQINMEYRIQTEKNIQWVGFVDIGNVFSESQSLTFDNLKVGKGFGVRYFTPIGPFRIDVGFGDYTIIHFNLGQVF